ncbi:receptor-type tyrosine-protein phosphatase S [Alosa pseudoharengus]|uniref:receptor-type tyrosine-protein phosphatase S n=1 Tax=Alosa pseudoharengus TaxID=34774 RepID=UPI003F89E7B1
MVTFWKRLTEGTPIRGALQIENSEETDQGKYECVASNVEGVRFSSPANLYVRVRRVPPRFSILPTNHEIMPGGSVNITCVAVGSPMPYVKWMLNSEDLTPEDEMPVGRNVLALDGIQESANYTCVAMSSLGIIEAVAQITVKSLPRPPGTPMVTETTATSITITWDSGNPDPVLYYIIQYRGKTADSKYETMDGITTTRYSIGGLSPNTDYEIRVSAFNTIGQGPPSEPVEARTGEQAPASPPRNVQARIISANTVVVRWDEPEEPNGQIKGYRVYYTMDDSQPLSQWQIHNVQDSVLTTIQSLVSSETYSIRVLAFTSVGDGPPSDPIQVKMVLGVPGQPEKFQVGSVSDTSIQLTWEPAGSLNYELRYREGAKGSEVTKKFGASSSYVVEGLKPNTEYLFSLAAISKWGIGAFTSEISQKTSQAKPSAPPREVKCSSSSSTSLLVSWLPPVAESQNGELTGYVVRHQVVAAEAGAVDEPKESDAPPSGQQLLLQGLEKWTQYSVSAAASTSKGRGPFSEPLVCRTDEDVPGGPPRRVEVEVLNSTAIKVTWRSLQPGRQHGQIRGYQVHYVRMENGESRGLPLIKDVMLADAQEMIIGGLQPNTTFSVTVAAYTTKGDGARSKAKIVATKGAVPGAPSLSVWQETASSALVRWQPPVPLTPGVELQGYRLQFGRKDVSPLATLEFTPRETEYAVTNVHRGATYLFRLSAKSRGGFGEEAVQELSVPEEVPRGYPQIADHANVTCCSVQLAWSPPVLAERNGAITEYTLAYQEASDAAAGSGSLRELSLPAGQSSYTLNGLRPDAAYDVKIRAHTRVGPGPYSPRVQYRTTARGSGRTRACVRLAPHGSGSVSAGSGPGLVSGPSRGSGPAPGQIWPGVGRWLGWGSLSPLFLLLSAPQDPGRLLHCLLKNSNRNTVFVTADSGLSSPLSEGGFDCESMMSHPPIPISELAEHTELLKANDNLKLSQEYESIDPGQQFTWEHSNLEVNKPKNRYANVIAYDHSRVILAPIEGITGSDYINANYIDGYRKQNAYIATQGPLPETFGDFWRMVWEQRSATVVMMTRLEEKSRVKCDQYWPSRGTETYGMTQVTLLDTIELATFCVRTFSLHKNGSSEKREVRQFQFTAWPDHGVPEYPTPFLAFLRRVKTCNPPDAGPIIAHCSAGVGRTGCFIVIDAMLERIKHEKTVDIYGHVTLMRAQRNYMVQTEDQYSFIHDALLEAVACGNTEVAARSLFSYIQKLATVETGEHVTGMELEFKRLANSKAHTSRFISANLPCNKFKNRLVNIMPYETTRVCLQPIRGLEGSDYINASFIDGYRQQKAYIATQGPLAETTEDFWRMMWENNSTIVVMLTKLREMGREKCHQYWPAERSARYQYFVVDPMAEYNMPQYILREFKVTDARDGQSRTVRQFQFTDWPEQGVPKSGEGFIDFIGQVHKTKEQFGQDGPISVHCSAGVGRTGVFITLSIVLERMRYEGVVDIFQTVKMLRTQRPAMVQTEDEYQFSYQAALEYLGSFDHYAT